MRKSHSRAGSRPLRVGIVTAATAALAVAGIASPAFAVVVDGTLSVTNAPVGGGTQTVLTAAGAFTGVTTNLGARFIASTGTCSTYGTTSATNLAATVTVSGNDATITVPALAAGTYKACVFGATSGTLGTATPTLAQSTNSLTVSVANTTPTLSPSAGTSAGGTSVTATGAGAYLASGGSTLGVTFRTTACSNTYSAVSPVVGTTATKNNLNTIATFTVPATLPAAGNYNVCIYAGTAATSALLASATYGALPTSTVSPSSGNSGGGNTIIVTTRTNTIATGTTPGAVFTPTTSCPTTAGTPGTNDVAATTVTRISATKAAIEVPGGVLFNSGGTGETTPWNVCVYTDNSTGRLLAVPTSYSVATRLDLTSVTISPAGGPAQGNSDITVTVTGGLPTATGATISASLGGSPLSNIQVSSDGVFTATTSAHAPGGTKLSVTTAAGSQTSASNVFTYSYGISVSPNTAPFSSTAVTLDILGSGFNSLVFDPAADATGSAIPGATADGVGVYLVDNGWYASAVTNKTVATTGLIAQCGGVTKISDNELICTLNLGKKFDGSYYNNTGNVARGVYNVAVVNDVSLSSTTCTSTPATGCLTADSNMSRISSGSTFTVSDY